MPTPASRAIALSEGSAPSSANARAAAARIRSWFSRASARSDRSGVVIGSSLDKWTRIRLAWQQVESAPLGAYEFRSSHGGPGDDALRRNVHGGGGARRGRSDGPADDRDRSVLGDRGR